MHKTICDSCGAIIHDRHLALFCDLKTKDGIETIMLSLAPYKQPEPYFDFCPKCLLAAFLKKIENDRNPALL